MIVYQKTKTEFLLQAYLAVNPHRPKWCEIELTSINGWQSYHWWESGKPRRDPRLTDDFGRWKFVNEEAAVSVLDELLFFGQRYWLRVVRRESVVEDTQVVGHFISDGTVVRKPDGSVPLWMGNPIESCAEDMPKLF